MSERLAGKVHRLEQLHHQALDLLGMALGTLVLDDNVKKLSETESGKALCEMARKWYERFVIINEESGKI